jgi:hypothetical protein
MILYRFFGKWYDMIVYQKNEWYVQCLGKSNMNCCIYPGKRGWIPNPGFEFWGWIPNPEFELWGCLWVSGFGGGL